MLIEFVLYATASGVEIENHLEKTRASHEAVIAAQAGFNSRAISTIASEEPATRWADLVIWESAEHVHAAMEKVGQAPEAKPWTSQMIPDGMVMRTAEVLYQLNRETPGVGEEAEGAWLIVTWKALPGVDFDEHVKGSRTVHEAVLTKLEGYRGGMFGYDAKRQEFIEVLAWRDLAAAEASLEAAITTTEPSFARHMAECDEESVTYTYLVPSLRFIGESVQAPVGG